MSTWQKEKREKKKKRVVLPGLPTLVHDPNLSKQRLELPVKKAMGYPIVLVGRVDPQSPKSLLSHPCKQVGPASFVILFRFELPAVKFKEGRLCWSLPNIFLFKTRELSSRSRKIYYIGRPLNSSLTNL